MFMAEDTNIQNAFWEETNSIFGLLQQCFVSLDWSLLLIDGLFLFHNFCEFDDGCFQEPSCMLMLFTCVQFSQKVIYIADHASLVDTIITTGRLYELVWSSCNVRLAAHI